MSAKFIFLAQGDTLPEPSISLVFRLHLIDNGAVDIQCQDSNELNAWSSILSISNSGEVSLYSDLPHGLYLAPALVSLLNRMGPP